jgi:hypothetical protein
MMQGTGATRAGVLLALLMGVLLLIVMAPSAARAAWKGADAHIVDPYGTGYVSLLNVRVANHAVNDSAAVTEVQFSDDGVDWLGATYTGQAQDWVLGGESGAKTLYVRFAAADGSFSPVIEACTTVDTQGPRTRALRAVRAAPGSAATFRYSVSDRVSPSVKAVLVISGAGGKQTMPLGWVRTGTRSVSLKLDLPAGTYRWRVRAMDLAHWTQERQVSQTLVVK